MAWRPHFSAAGVTVALLLLASGTIVAVGPLEGRRASGAPVPDGPRVTLANASTGDPAIDREIERWTTRTRLNGRDADAWLRLADHLMQGARQTGNASFYTRAEAAYQRALALEPDNSHAMTGMAWVCGGRHEFEQSIAWANRALALNPEDDAAHGLIGDAAVEMGDYAAAGRHYQRMLDLRPGLSSYSRAAHLLHLTGDTMRATLLMRKAIEAGSPHAENTAWCRAELALMYWRTGALMPAEQLLIEGLRQAPDNLHLHLAMARVQAGRGRHDAAIEHYRKAQAISPRPDAAAALGDLYTLTGKQEEARREYARVEELHNSQHEHGGAHDHGFLARFYADQGRNLPHALRLAEEEYRRNPSVHAADTLAWCYYKNDRYEEAREAIRKALAHRTPEAAFHFHAGMIYAALKDRRTAQLNFQRALSLNPGFSPKDAPVAVKTLADLGAARSVQAPP
jgi:tetratricopeptide (TPR) repeat protein